MLFMPVRQNYEGFDNNESLNAVPTSPLERKVFFWYKKRYPDVLKVVFGGQKFRRIWQSLIFQVRFCGVIVGRIPYKSDNSDYYLLIVYIFSIP